ncbi:Lipid transport protein N-terminal [Trinorchestia longiramus]|nr:Lipid transport protein N-terminal [Trinorchestia longiramus]
MRLLLLCCIVCVVQDCCLGLDPDPLGLDDALEYHYKFEGRVAVDLGGIGSKPDARDDDQMAGAVISGKLIVQKTGHINIGFKLSDLKVGDHLGRVACNGAATLPVDYRPMPEPMAAQLSKPFFFHLDPSDPVSKIRLEVPKDDLLWMVNVRKSLLNNLQDYMVITFAKLHQNRNFDRHLRQKSSIKFSPIMEHVVEDTLFGLCGVWYTIESATEASLDQVRNSPLSHDMQLPRFQGRKLRNGRRIFPFASESLMRVTRVIDHASCLQQPRLIRSTVANFSDFALPSPAHHLQRHSTYTYYVRGNPFNIYRLEHVQVQGFLSYNPFGFNSERLQTVTNQTMVLESVAEKQHNLQPDHTLQVLTTLKQSVESPYGRPSSGALDWIVYNMSNSDPDSPEPVYWEKVLLGHPVTSEIHHQYKDDLRELLRRSLLSLQTDTLMPWEDSAESLGGSSVGQAAAQLHSAARLAAALPTSALQELWDDIPQAHRYSKQHRETFLKVLSSSGSGPAAGLVLHLITPQGPDSPLPVPTRKHPSLLLAMAANTPDPSLAVPLVQYLQAMNLRKEPVVGPIVYVSGATILHRMCYNSSAVPSPLYGSHQCPVQYVIQNFAHYLRKMIETSDADRWWERATFLQAYATLGLDIDLVLLESLGRTDPNLIVRTTAVYALSPRYLNSAFKHKVRPSSWLVPSSLYLKSHHRGQGQSQGTVENVWQSIKTESSYTKNY